MKNNIHARIKYGSVDPQLLICALESIMGSPVIIYDGNGCRQALKNVRLDVVATSSEYAYLLGAMLPNRNGELLYSLLWRDEDDILLYPCNPFREQKNALAGGYKSWVGVLTGLCVLAGSAKIFTVNGDTCKLISEHKEREAYEGMFHELMAERGSVVRQRALYCISKYHADRESYLAALAKTESAFKKCVKWHKMQATGPDETKPLESGNQILYMAYRALPYTERLCMLAYALYRQAGGTLNAPDFTDKLLNGSNAELYTPLNRAFAYVENEYKGGE